MSEECYQPVDYDRLMELIGNPDEDQEDLLHLESCAECRTKLDQYRSFLSRDPVPEGANLADAHVRLGDFLEREIGTATPHRAHRRPGNLRRWSPVLVAASLVCVVLLVNNRQDGRLDNPSGAVRDLSTPTSALSTSERPGEDGFFLTWTGPAEADEYKVVVLNATMAEIDRISVTGSGEYRLRQAGHPWFKDPGPYFWYLVALHDGDEIARSAVRALESDH